MRTRIYRIVFFFVAVLFTAASVLAQEGPEPQGGQDQPRRQNNPGANLLRQLGLDREQMQQLRQINVRRQPLMENAQRRFREANRRLDESIYADQLVEAEVQERIKEVQLLHAELIRLRSMNELSIRKILTPDQLNKFRRLRQRFDEVNSRPGRQADRLPPSDGKPPVQPEPRRD
jgi:Spy/CpxP family protein refolding chaperone